MSFCNQQEIQQLSSEGVVIVCIVMKNEKQISCYKRTKKLSKREKEEKVYFYLVVGIDGRRIVTVKNGRPD